MVESELESESTRKNEYYQQKIERLTNDYENQNRQKNQELDEIFEELSLENDNLKKELLLTKEELEAEIEKNIDIKNSIYNFNYFTKQTSKDLDEKLGKNRSIKEYYTNSAFTDYIKTIKEEANKELSGLNSEQENNIKNFELMKASLENKIKNLHNLLKDDEKMNIYFNEILNEFNIFHNKYYSLLLENISNKKYNIIYSEKLGLAREEILFLKERIVIEKKLILEKINSLSHDNEFIHLNMIQEILNEINQKRKNYFNEKFYFSIKNINQSFLEYKEKEKELLNKNENLKKELEELKYKFSKVNDEKNKLMENAVNYTINKESIKNNETYLQSMINKIRKEKLILENENNSLLKNNSELQQQIMSINNQMKFEINKKSNDSSTIIKQKDIKIQELNKKINTMIETNSKDKITINNLNEEIESLNNKIREYLNKENNYKSEIILLKRTLKESNYKSNTLGQINTTDSFNNVKTNQNIFSEKKTLRDKSDISNRNNSRSNKEKSKITSTEKSNSEEYNILNTIKKIYLNHFSNDVDNNDEMYMLKEINNKLNQLEKHNNNSIGNNKFIKLKIIYNEDFEALERNKNSQLYENILIYLFHLKTQQQIEINKIINNYAIPSDKKNDKLSQIFDKLKSELDEKCSKFEERMKNSVNVEEVEQLISEIKALYEIIIDYIIQSFYKYKRDLVGNILTIQLPLDEYHRIINNTSANLANVENNIVNQMNEYKAQNVKIENALNLLKENVDGNLNQ